MTPKEKAQELVSRFVSINLSQVNDLVDGIRIRLAKESALIAVNEIIDYLPRKETNSYLWYWQEVKRELENLKHQREMKDKQRSTSQVEDKQRSTSQVEDKHTPGPWIVAEDQVGDDDGNTIADVTLFNEWNTTEGIVTKKMPWEANARLIAAAPEMLDLLSECLEQLEALHYLYEGEFSERIESADKAAVRAWKLIAKLTER